MSMFACVLLANLAGSGGPNLASLRGFKQGLYLEYVDRDSVRVLPGELFVQGGAGGRSLLQLPVEIELDLPLLGTAADAGFWYVYMRKRAPGMVVVGRAALELVHEAQDLAGDIGAGSRPVRDSLRRGWYHPGPSAGNQSLRCIGAVRCVHDATLGSILVPFSSDGRTYYYQGYGDEVFDENGDGTSFFGIAPWREVQFPVPTFASTAVVSVSAEHGGPSVSPTLQVLYRQSSDSPGFIKLVAIESEGTDGNVTDRDTAHLHLAIGSALTGEFSVRSLGGGGGALDLGVTVYGWAMGYWMGDTPAGSLSSPVEALER